MAVGHLSRDLRNSRPVNRSYADWPTDLVPQGDSGHDHVFATALPVPVVRHAWSHVVTHGFPVINDIRNDAIPDRWIATWIATADVLQTF